MDNEGRQTNQDSTTDELVESWVTTSILLDLWQDEEGTFSRQDTEKLQSGLESAIGNGWKKAWKGLEIETATNPNLGIIKRKVGAARPGISVKSWWRRFVLLKAARVQTNLAYNRSAFRFAFGEDTDGKTVREARTERTHVLDWLASYCEAALYALDESRPGRAVAPGKSRRDPTRERQRSVLKMLFHSEFCASATSELSLAHAKRIGSALGERVPHIGLPDTVFQYFKDLAVHNHARGENHRNNHREAVVLLKRWLTKDRLCPDLGVAKDASMSSVFGHLRRRIFVFPVLLTLADALESMKRLSEAQWYLEQGDRLAASDADSYWKQVFIFKRLAYSPRLSPPLTNAAPLTMTLPKLRQLRAEAEYSQQEVYLIDAAMPVKSSDSTVSIPDPEPWLKTMRQNLRWHIADAESFLKRLENSAKALGRVGKVVGENEDLRVPNNSSVRLNLFDLVSLAAKNQGRFRETLSLLAGETNEAPHGSERWVCWSTAVALLGAAKDIKHPALKDWLGDRCQWPDWLGGLNKRLEDIRDVISDTISQALLLKHLGLPTQHRRKCPLYSEPEENCKSGHAQGCSTECLMMSTDKKVSTLRYYLAKMAANSSHFQKYLDCHTVELAGRNSAGQMSRLTPNMELIVLRRWNSFSPNLNSLSSIAVGGGYLLRCWSDKQSRYIGVVIDPGYNFLQNLFNEGFTVTDLDVVVMTHAHPDHIDNISNILTLLREQQKRTVDRRIKALGRPLTMVMTEAVHDRLYDLLKAESEFVENIVVTGWSTQRSAGNGLQRDDSQIHLLITPESAVHAKLGDKEWEDCPTQPAGIKLKAIPALHYDGTSGDSMGILVSVKRSESTAREKWVHVAILSDTRFFPVISEALLPECKVVVAHLGAVIDEKLYAGFHHADPDKQDLLQHLHQVGTVPCERDKRECIHEALKKVLEDKNHLYLPGMTGLLCHLRRLHSLPGDPGVRPLLVMSEFGEEMRGGLRQDLARRLRMLGGDEQAVDVLAADVGMRIDVERRLVRCVVCQQYVKPDWIEPVVVSPADEAIFYVCQDCILTRKWELPVLLEQRQNQPKPLHVRK